MASAAQSTGSAQAAIASAAQGTAAQASAAQSTAGLDSAAQSAAAQSASSVAGGRYVENRPFGPFQQATGAEQHPHPVFEQWKAAAAGLPRPAGVQSSGAISALPGSSGTSLPVSLSAAGSQSGAGQEGGIPFGPLQKSSFQESFPNPTLIAMKAERLGLASSGAAAGLAVGRSLPTGAASTAGSGTRQVSQVSGAGSSQAGSDIIFVTWIAFGDAGDAGFKTHNFHKVDMRWADVARKSHPGCKIGLVMDQDTQLEDPSQVDVLHRLNVDKSKFGRNEYNDLYHWAARYSMLEKLMADGNDRFDVVFMDPDVLVVGDLSDAFAVPFDYAVTISEGAGQPINGAMHFVHAKQYDGAIATIKGVLEGYQINHEVGFTSGQRAYSDYLGISDDFTRVKLLNQEAVEQGSSCITAHDQHVCFLTCLRYNFWEDCDRQPTLRIRSDVAEDYFAADVKVLHFIAYRKLGIQEVYEAYMASGNQQAALAAFAALPHTEAGFGDSKRFSSIA